MTDDDKPDNVSDLNARFRLDQQAASEEERTREQVQWDLAVAGTQGDIQTKLGYAAHLQAKAAFWKNLADLLNLVWGVLLVAAIALGVVLIVEAFR